jgi:uncharacterized membrane protein HdeD (DUF308 family)
MSTRAREDVGEVLLRAGRSWGWALTFGIISAVAGVLVLMWPGKTLIVLAVLVGVQLIVAGIFRFVEAIAFGSDEGGGTRVLLAILGVLSLIVGLYALRHVLLTLVALALILGIFWIVNGVVDVVVAIGDRGLPRRGWRIALGALSIVAGLVVLANPELSLLALAWVAGVWLLVLGVAQIVLAFRLRGAGAAAGPAAAFA